MAAHALPVRRGVHALIVAVQVRVEKRLEFVLSTRALIEAAPGCHSPVMIAASLEDANALWCCSQWESATELREFLATDGFRALRGAVRTLAVRGDFQVLERVQPTGAWAGLVPGPTDGDRGCRDPRAPPRERDRMG